MPSTATNRRTTNKRTTTPHIHPTRRSGFTLTIYDWRYQASGGSICLRLGVLESTSSLPSSVKREEEDERMPSLCFFLSLLFPRRPCSTANTTPPLWICLGIDTAGRPYPFTAKPSLRTTHGKLRTHHTHNKRFPFVCPLTSSFIPSHKPEHTIVNRNTNDALTQNKENRR